MSKLDFLSLPIDIINIIDSYDSTIELVLCDICDTAYKYNDALYRSFWIGHPDIKGIKCNNIYTGIRCDNFTMCRLNNIDCYITFAYNYKLLYRDKYLIDAIGIDAIGIDVNGIDASSINVNSVSKITHEYILIISINECKILGKLRTNIRCVTDMQCVNNKLIIDTGPHISLIVYDIDINFNITERIRNSPVEVKKYLLYVDDVIITSHHNDGNNLHIYNMSLEYLYSIETPRSNCVKNPHVVGIYLDMLCCINMLQVYKLDLTNRCVTYLCTLTKCIDALEFIKN